MIQIKKYLQNSQLLWKYFNKDISSQELKVLDEMFIKDPKLKEWFESFIEEDNLNNKLHQYRSIDIDKKWTAFTLYRNCRKNTKRETIKFLLKLAAVVLPIAFALCFIMHLFSFNSDRKESTGLETSKTMITLSDGEHIALTDGINDTINDGGTKNITTLKNMMFNCCLNSDDGINEALVLTQETQQLKLHKSDNLITTKI